MKKKEKETMTSCSLFGAYIITQVIYAIVCHLSSISHQFTKLFERFAVNFENVSDAHV